MEIWPETKLKLEEKEKTFDQQLKAMHKDARCKGVQI